LKDQLFFPGQNPPFELLPSTGASRPISSLKLSGRIEASGPIPQFFTGGMSAATNSHFGATWPRWNPRNAARLELTHRALEKTGVSVSFSAHVAHAARSARGIGFGPDRP
jgi:hypothetical protein